MRYRNLGADGAPRVSAVGLNCHHLTAGADPAGARHLLGQLGGIGVNLVDVSGGAEVERLVGRALLGRRDEFVMTARHQPDRRSPDTPAGIRQACEAMLRRLRTDRIDIFYAGGDRPAAERLEALVALVEAGKIRHAGLHRVDAAGLREAYAAHPVTAVAVDYSLMGRRRETDLLPAAFDLGVGVAAYSPLARGLLAGWAAGGLDLAAGDPRSSDPRFAPANLARNRQLTRVVQRLAASRNLSVARLALAWVLARHERIIAVPGTRNLTHVEMNASAADLDLDPADVARLSTWLPVGAVGGD